MLRITATKRWDTICKSKSKKNGKTHLRSKVLLRFYENKMMIKDQTMTISFKYSIHCNLITFI